MTLQQKLLAKQSKKGFTLVELVVVIAILGILAAIAIPAVIGIISSANESQAKSDASSVNTACKNMYAEVVAGTVNNANPGSITTDATNLPAANDPASTRKTKAASLTVQQALEYAGLTTLANKVGDFVYMSNTNTKDTTIYADVDKSKPSTIDGTANSAKAEYTAVTLTTKMSDLHYDKAAAANNNNQT